MNSNIEIVSGKRHIPPSWSIFGSKWTFDANIENETSSAESLLQATIRRSLSVLRLKRLTMPIFKKCNNNNKKLPFFVISQSTKRALRYSRNQETINK